MTVRKMDAKMILVGGIIFVHILRGDVCYEKDKNRLFTE